MATSMVDVDGRAPMAKEVVIGDVLDREERSREATRERDEKLNLPGADVPMGADRVDERALTQQGRQEYLEREMVSDEEVGEPFDAEDEGIVEAVWVKMFKKPFPYEFGDSTDRELQMLLARKDIEQGYLGEMARGEVYGSVKVEGVGAPIEVLVDPKEVRNRKAREAIKHLGGVDFVRDIWKDAKSLTLYSPYVDGLGWVVKVEDDKGRFLAMSLKDLERMFFVDGEKERMQVVLPKPGDGTYAGTRDLILAIKRLKSEGGTILPAKIDLALELLR